MKGYATSHTHLSPWLVRLLLALGSPACLGQEISGSASATHFLEVVPQSSKPTAAFHAQLRGQPVKVSVRPYWVTLEGKNGVLAHGVTLAEVQSTVPGRPFYWCVPLRPGVFHDVRILETDGDRGFLTWLSPAGTVWISEIAGDRSRQDGLGLWMNPPISRYADRIFYRSIGDWLSLWPGSARRPDLRLLALSADDEGRLIADVVGKVGWPVYVMRRENGHWRRVNWYSPDRLLAALLAILVIGLIVRRSRRRRNVRAQTGAALTPSGHQ